MGTKNKPGMFDCYEAAHPDEPMFVLLGRDPIAPILVDLWAQLRKMTRGMSSKVMEAKACGAAMLAWLRDKDELEKVDDVRLALADAFKTGAGEFELVASKELLELREDARTLRKLRDAGVDNWEGYSGAFSEDDDEEDEEKEVD